MLHLCAGMRSGHRRHVMHNGNQCLADHYQNALVQKLLIRTQHAFGEAITHMFVDGELVQLKDLFEKDKQYKVPSNGTMSFTYFITRPKAMIKSMAEQRYKFDLSRDVDRLKAEFLREYVLEDGILMEDGTRMGNPTQPIWCHTMLDGKPIKFVQICSKELWTIPDRGVLKFKFLNFTVSGVPCIFLAS